MAKKNKTPVKRALPRKRTTALGIPAMNPAPIKAAAAEIEETTTPEPATKVEKSGGLAPASTPFVGSFVRDANGGFSLHFAIHFSADEVAAICTSEMFTVGDEDAVHRTLVDFAHDAVQDAVAEAEAELDGSGSRYQPAAGEQGSEAPLRQD